MEEDEEEQVTLKSSPDTTGISFEIAQDIINELIGNIGHLLVE